MENKEHPCQNCEHAKKQGEAIYCVAVGFGVNCTFYEACPYPSRRKVKNDPA